MRAEVDLPQGVEVRRSKADAGDDKKYQCRTLFVASLTLVAIVGYAVLVYFQWREMIGATDAAQRGVDETRLNRIQADKVLSATIEQFHLDQRAWVGPVQTMPPEDLRVGGRPRFGVWAANTGKTPAINFKFLANFRAVKKGEPFRPEYGKATGPQSAITMFPNMRAPLITPRATADYTQAYLDELTSGKAIIWIYGQMSYDDIFDRTHHSTFCLWVGEDLTSTTSCETYNHVD